MGYALEQDDETWDWLCLMEDGRYTGTCVEGTTEEWIAIARAILEGKDESFRRCAAHLRNGYYEFNSPRNSVRGDEVLMMQCDAEEFAKGVISERAGLQHGAGI